MRAKVHTMGKAYVLDLTQEVQFDSGSKLEPDGYCRSFTPPYSNHFLNIPEPLFDSEVEFQKPFRFIFGLQAP
jgi:hypothetical protein